MFKERNKMSEDKIKEMFEATINEEAIDALTEEQVDQILAILIKAGY